MHPFNILAAGCRTLARWIEPQRTPEQLFVDMVFEVFDTGTGIIRTTTRPCTLKYASYEAIKHAETGTAIEWSRAFYGEPEVYAAYGAERACLRGSDARRAKRLILRIEQRDKEAAERARLAALLPRFESWLAQPTN